MSNATNAPSGGSAPVTAPVNVVSPTSDGITANGITISYTTNAVKYGNVVQLTIVCLLAGGMNAAPTTNLKAMNVGLLPSTMNLKVKACSDIDSEDHVYFSIGNYLSLVLPAGTAASGQTYSACITYIVP